MGKLTLSGMGLFEAHEGGQAVTFSSQLSFSYTEAVTVNLSLYNYQP